MEVHSSGVSDSLGGLVHTIVWNPPVNNPHPKKRQEGWIVDLGLIHLLEPFGPSDHVGPKTIIKEEVWIYIMPPLIVGGFSILPSLDDPMEGVLGDLSFSVSVSNNRNEEGNTSKVEG